MPFVLIERLVVCVAPRRPTSTDQYAVGLLAKLPDDDVDALCELLAALLVDELQATEQTQQAPVPTSEPSEAHDE